MKEKKKLKRLVLKKEEIINLNDFQMKKIQGGTGPLTPIVTSSQACIESVLSAYGIATSIYDGGVKLSLWDCPYSQQENCMTEISNRVLNLPDGSRPCNLPDFYVDGLQPHK